VWLRRFCFYRRPFGLGFGLALLVARAPGWFQKFFAGGSFFLTARRARRRYTAVIINA
jgi:hypothetical protein